MSKYMMQFNYSHASIKGLVEQPQNRRAAAEAIFGKMGGTISEMYFSFGDYDGLAIVDFPSDIDATAALLAVTASGAFAKTKTTVLIELEDSVKSMEIARETMSSYAVPAS